MRLQRSQSLKGEEYNNYSLCRTELANRSNDIFKQLVSWQLVTGITLILLCFIVASACCYLLKHKDRLFIAEVTKEGRVVNVVRLDDSLYHPTMAAKQYFIEQFIRNIREIYLDPIVMRKNWRLAYYSVAQGAFNKLKAIYAVKIAVKISAKRLVSY